LNYQKDKIGVHVKVKCIAALYEIPKVRICFISVLVMWILNMLLGWLCGFQDTVFP